MKSKGMILAAVGIIIVVGFLVQRSYSSSALPDRKPDPQKNALPLDALKFAPVDRASYELGYAAAKSPTSAAKKPKDWVSYWLGYGEESGRKAIRHRVRVVSPTSSMWTSAAFKAKY